MHVEAMPTGVLFEHGHVPQPSHSTREPFDEPLNVRKRSISIMLSLSVGERPQSIEPVLTARPANHGSGSACRLAGCPFRIGRRPR
jgi:hypothetical protein